MRAVWSFWSKPWVTGRSLFWASEKHHWLSWVLSVETARAHFVHLDSDVYLWKRLPEALESADVFAQNPEPAMPGSGSYRPERLEQALREGWFPEEWH